MEMFLLALLSFLSVIGIVEIIRKVVFWFKKPPKTIFYMGAVIHKTSEAELIVRSLIDRIRWMDLNCAIRLILVDKSEDPEVKIIVDKLISNTPNVTLL